MTAGRWSRKAWYAAFAGGGAAYLAWRALFTLSGEWPLWSACFLAAEVWV